MLIVETRCNRGFNVGLHTRALVHRGSCMAPRDGAMSKGTQMGPQTLLKILLPLLQLACVLPLARGHDWWPRISVPIRPDHLPDVPRVRVGPSGEVPVVLEPANIEVRSSWFIWCFHYFASCATAQVRHLYYSGFSICTAGKTNTVVLRLSSCAATHGAYRCAFRLPCPKY